jgi:hypothetical protein
MPQPIGKSTSNRGNGENHDANEEKASRPPPANEKTHKRGGDPIEKEVERKHE